MDSYQPPHHYMRPPPPPPPAPPSMGGDPHMQHHPPPPPTGSWFSGQFHYHPSHSPSPPPPQQLPPPHQQNQWAPPPPPHPYNAPYPPQQQQQQSPYTLPPPPPPPNHPYPHPNQDWGNANWTHHSGWEYPGHGNEEDWAARARAWASARSAMENQHPQSQFTPLARQDERSNYSNQYSQPVESHYQDHQHTTVPSSGFQNYQPPAAPLSRPPMAHQLEPAPMSSYGADGHFSFIANDRAPGGDINAAYRHHQGTSNSAVHQQEVPSSYSSAPGNQEDLEGRQHGNSLVADGRAMSIEQAQFPYSNNSLNPMDQPLEFTPRFSHENDQTMRSGYPDSLALAKGTDTGVVSSLHPWTATAAPAGSYPPIPPAFPLAPQDDPSMGLPSFPGQPPARMFERGASFQPAVPSIAGPVGLGGGTTLQPPAAFPVDAYGSSVSAERPKKAAVPNWLRAEIIKNKATITSSVSEHFKEGTQSVDDEALDKSIGKGDLADSKSMDSSKSAEEEDEEEDYKEAQRIGAINQEIKRVLTEVLLKVTDDLFDEIATKVLDEDSPTTNVMPTADNGVRNQRLSPPPPPVPIPKASAKVLVAKAKESVSENASTESSSGSPGNVLGLANYVSDDDDGENLTSTVPKDEKNAPHGAGENGHPPSEAVNHSRSLVSTESECGNRSSFDAVDDKDLDNDDYKTKDKDLDDNGVHQAYCRIAGSGVGKSYNVNSDAVKSVDSIGKETIRSADVPVARHHSRKSSTNDYQGKDVRRHDKLENKRESSGKDMDHLKKEVDRSKEREDEKVESHGKRDERHRKKEKEEDHNVMKERSKEHRIKDKDKTRDSDGKKRSPHRDSKDSKKERERDKKSSGKDDADRRRERTKDEKDDKSRHKSSRRHKRKRSSSVDHRSKQNKGSPVVSDGSSSEASDDSRRRANPKKRDLSPSPVRSRQRFVLTHLII